MKVHEELELSRHNVTPAQFLAYVRGWIRDKGFTGICAEDLDLNYWKGGYDIEFDYHDDPEKPCKAEKSVSKPYQMQTYIRQWNGDVYNMICEFDFWDDKTGFGYFYYINKCDA